MKIEIITTGDEVVNGVIVDTNSARIAERCAQMGHEVARHTSVADILADIGDALKGAAARADAVIVSGGLGPTVDDLTHTLIPAGGKVLPNKVGTAPGIQVKLGRAEVFFLPGVPKELFQIFDDSVRPWLEGRAGEAVSERVLRCFGLPEATIDERLQGVDLCGTRLSFRVKFPEILLKVVARAGNPADAKQATSTAAANIRERLGEVVYADGETSLAAVVGAMLCERKMKIAVAESCTGGLLSSTITDVSGSSAWFERGIVSYSNVSKVELLGVTEEMLRAFGAVSRETAMSMAEGIKRKSGASIGLGITGIAGPGGGTPEKPVGTVHIALAHEGGTEEREFHFNRDRLWFKQIVAATALDLVRKHLLERFAS
ncbi:MAG: nicotinamide-nucleotide amidohydrolase family protein [Pseudomonadota bacterium]